MMVEYNLFRMSANEEITKEDLHSFIAANIHISTHRYAELKNAYLNLSAAHTGVYDI